MPTVLFIHYAPTGVPICGEPLHVSGVNWVNTREMFLRVNNPCSKCLDRIATQILKEASHAAKVG
jgi:hypothetical protein